MAIVVMVDGGANLSKSVLKKHSITLLPYNIAFSNGGIYKPAKNHDELIKLIDNYKEVPKIESISEEEIELCFRKFIDKGDDILFISTSSSLSKTYAKVVNVKNKFNSSTIEVIDSNNVGSGQALLALYARDYLEKGYGLKQSAKYLNRIKNFIRSCYMIGNPSLLCNHDRCRHISNQQFDFCHRTPIVEIREGKIVLTFSAKDSELALQMLKNAIHDSIKTLSLSHIIISYSGDKVNALKLKRYANKILKEVNIEILENNEILFVATGDNSLSLAFLINSD